MVSWQLVLFMVNILHVGTGVTEHMQVPNTIVYISTGKHFFSWRQEVRMTKAPKIYRR